MTVSGIIGAIKASVVAVLLVLFKRAQVMQKRTNPVFENGFGETAPFGNPSGTLPIIPQNTLATPPKHHK